MNNITPKIIHFDVHDDDGILYKCYVKKEFEESVTFSSKDIIEKPPVFFLDDGSPLTRSSERSGALMVVSSGVILTPDNDFLREWLAT